MHVAPRRWAPAAIAIGTAFAVAGCSSASDSSPATTTTSSIVASSTTRTGSGTTVTSTTSTTSSGSTTSSSGRSGGIKVEQGSANIDGKRTSTTEIQAGPGSSARVTAAVGSVVDILAPGPSGWQLSPEPDPTRIETIDSDRVPDGREDPFPEAGGATIITVRPLVAGTTELTVVASSGGGDPITVTIDAA